MLVTGRMSGEFRGKFVTPSTLDTLGTLVTRAGRLVRVDVFGMKNFEMERKVFNLMYQFSIKLLFYANEKF